MKWNEYKAKKMENPKFKQTYDELEVEYAIMNEILRERFVKNDESQKVY